ncbi:hypothetical protein [Streptomyces sp. P17]|uniref:hypothetical protein n=1 Tax=Streptomyces sp. P17 TaxID=3074716 RepID=UPI0028F407A2|nr:hypothetical protein [Streptomyces sp. P17]MDT9701264.1 hypothetical protein [Streptomyces sp. P17]
MEHVDVCPRSTAAGHRASDAGGVRSGGAGLSSPSLRGAGREADRAARRPARHLARD